MPGFPFSMIFGPSEDEKRRERASRAAVGAPIPVPERSYFTTSAGPSYLTSMPTSVVLWDQARPADAYRTEAPDDDRYGFKARSAAARADAAARGLTEGYWWARWSPERSWEPVRLDLAEIEGIEPYLEVWGIGCEYAEDLDDFFFLSKIASPDGYLG